MLLNQLLQMPQATKLLFIDFLVVISKIYKFNRVMCLVQALLNQQLMLITFADHDNVFVF